MWMTVMVILKRRSFYDGSKVKYGLHLSSFGSSAYNSSILCGYSTRLDLIHSPS